METVFAGGPQPFILREKSCLHLHARGGHAKRAAPVKTHKIFLFFLLLRKLVSGQFIVEE